MRETTRESQATTRESTQEDLMKEQKKALRDKFDDWVFRGCIYTLSHVVEFDTHYLEDEDENRYPVPVFNEEDVADNGFYYAYLIFGFRLFHFLQAIFIYLF